MNKNLLRQAVENVLNDTSNNIIQSDFYFSGDEILVAEGKDYIWVQVEKELENLIRIKRNQQIDLIL